MAFVRCGITGGRDIVEILGYCVYHDRLVDEIDCRVHDDGTTCEDCQHLFSEFAEPLTVDEYAKKAGLNRSKVLRSVREGKLTARKFDIPPKMGHHPKYGYSRWLIDGGAPAAERPPNPELEPKPLSFSDFPAENANAGSVR
jgi:hypothetical protein